METAIIYSGLIAKKFANVYMEAGFLLQRLRYAQQIHQLFIHVTKKTNSNSFAIAFSKA